MGKILTAARHWRNDDIFKRMSAVLNDPSLSKAEAESKLKDIIDGSLALADLAREKEPGFDFSTEKGAQIFARDDALIIRPITPADEAFYCHVRKQESRIYNSKHIDSEEKLHELFESEVFDSTTFVCMIDDAHDSRTVGYVTLKDTSAEIWEIAIELDHSYVHRGIGPHAIRLFLNEIHRLTERSVVRAVIEVDNVASQRCFEKAGAEFAGLVGNYVLKTDDERTRFEEENLDLIDDQIKELAGRFGASPRALLSHLLEYRLRLPIRAEKQYNPCDS